jgi:iron complex transport system substrate-binding protein
MKRILIFTLAVLLLLSGCAAPAAQPTAAPTEAPAAAPTSAPTAAPTAAPSEAPPEGVHKTGSMELEYATQFAVDYYSDGSALLTIGDDRFLILPEGVDEPGFETEAVVIRRPLDRIYMAASSALDLFLCMDSLDKVRFTSTTRSNWALPEVVQAIDDGSLLYAGKYSAPDFEMLLEEKCSLAVESTMIYHSPAIKEQIETLEIPVIVERSSYETHPLGRVEWIKVYGLLFGLEAEAEAFFSAQTAQLADIRPLSGEAKTVAFFHINSVGAAVVRKPGDYVSKMIAMAGGTYVPAELEVEENALSTMNLQMEAFYYGAKDADYLIYNSTIDGNLDTIEQLLGKSSLLADFKAVQNGNVWCTEQSMFQQSSASAGMIMDLNAIITGTAESDSLRFLHRLK